MADIVTPEVRSRLMAGIGPTNTKPEMLIRRRLHALGYRYRLHVKGLPGKPDLVFPSRRAAIFVHGCFWHGHNCTLFRWPATREEFWRSKIGGNVARDRRNDAALEAGLGERLALIPQMTDPKNLFGMLLQDAANTACASQLLAA